MKWLLLIVTLLLAQVASAQDNVTFIHGLNSDADAWSKAASRFESLYDITSKRIEYSSTPTISAIASSHYPSIFDSTIIVAHSIGGLVAREMVRTNPNGKIRALVTVGAPHTGATGAELPGSNRVATMIGRWVYDLARP